MNELMTVGGTDAMGALVARRKMINEVMQKVMQRGTDYGTIPGCGDKPALFKPGAEKLCSVFGLAPEFIVEDLGNADERRYRVRTRLLSAAGAFLGEGVGECSSNEEKYRWKGARRVEFDHTPEDRRQIKYKSEKGKEVEILQVRTNPADVANTVLKMGKKRSLVDGVLTVTATSDLMTQDIEEFNSQNVVEAEVVHHDPVTPKPIPTTSSTTSAAIIGTKPDIRILGIVEGTKRVYQAPEKDGVKPPAENYMVYIVQHGKDKLEMSCWEPAVCKVLSDAADAGLKVSATILTKGERMKIVKAEAETNEKTYELKTPEQEKLEAAQDKIADLIQGSK